MRQIGRAITIEADVKKNEATAFWVVIHKTQAFELNCDCSSTKAFVTLGRKKINLLCEQALRTKPILDYQLVSPVTQDAKVLCQGANYRQHMIDSGMKPDAKQFNMFFTKSSASITSHKGHIKKPDTVQLLDYEIELCLILGKESNQSLEINQSNLADYVVGICIGNDVSARDVQIPQMQFHKGKSYRTFCPLGPYLVLLDEDEMHYLDKMELTLRVNGEQRQRDNTKNLVYKPAETLTEFSQIVNFNEGDVLMTGTPSGCALALPSPWLVTLTSLLPDSLKWRLFNKTQLKRRQYLQLGDQLELTIKSHDGHLDLGMQQHKVS